MTTLAIDTCFAACSVAVLLPDRTVTRFEVLGRGHAERLMPMLDDAISDAGLGYDGLANIVVTTGPGTFTGLRIGIAAARALALALKIPVYAVSSLELIARTAVAQRGPVAPGAHVAVAMAARNNETYFQDFAADLMPLREPMLISLDAVSNELSAETALVVGTGSEEVAARWSNKPASVRFCSEIQPDARYIASPSERAYPCGEVRPLYLRPPDAKPQTSPLLLRPE